MSTPVKGRARDVLNRVEAWVNEALDRYYTEYYVTPNYKEDVTIQRIFPCASIRVDPVNIIDETFGRYLPNKGSTADYEFSIHAYQKFNSGSGEDYNEDAQLLATRVMKWIQRKNQNDYEKTNHGIRNVLDVASRESDPNLRNIARMIIEGRVEVNREDSP
jgi:hypothetical protein